MTAVWALVGLALVLWLIDWLWAWAAEVDMNPHDVPCGDEVPEAERWLWDNPEALRMARQGAEEAARGELHYLGSFAEPALPTLDEAAARLRGFKSTFSKMWARLSPEQKQEFIARCAATPEVSGMPLSEFVEELRARAPKE